MCEDLSDISIANMPEQAITIQEDYKSIGESRSRARGGVGYKKPGRVLDEEEKGNENFRGLCEAALRRRRSPPPRGKHASGKGFSVGASAAGSPFALRRLR